ncbi:unnamed protein product, partial [Prorocentrum cordatum]
RAAAGRAAPGGARPAVRHPARPVAPGGGAAAAEGAARLSEAPMRRSSAPREGRGAGAVGARRLPAEPHLRVGAGPRARGGSSGAGEGPAPGLGPPGGRPADGCAGAAAARAWSARFWSGSLRPGAGRPRAEGGADGGGGGRRAACRSAPRSSQRARASSAAAGPAPSKERPPAPKPPPPPASSTPLCAPPSRGGRRPGGRLPISRLRLRRRGPCLRPLPARRRVPPSSGVHSARGSALGAPPDRTSLSGALGRLLPAPPPVAPRGHWPDRAEGGGPARRALCMPRWLRPRIGEAPSHRLPMRTSGSPRVACQAEAFFLDPPASRPGSAAGALSYPSVQELGGGGSWRDFGSLSAEHLSAWSFAAAFVPGFAVYLCVAICTYVYLCVRMCACMRMFAFTPVVYIAVCEMHGMRRNAGVPSGQHCRMNTRQHNAGRILFQAVSGQRVRSSV